MIEAARKSADVDAAAQIWAEATAARDGDKEIAELRFSRPVIQEVLDRSPRSVLLVDRAADGTATGFAVAEPLPGAAAVAQLRYLGVRPGLWGQGIAERLLRELRLHLQAASFTRAQLSVYASNRRATALYERLGWHSVGQPAPHPRTGKPEQRYELTL
jgi:ribosomal protein S18 acetylase RimI-like enzyme